MKGNKKMRKMKKLFKVLLLVLMLTITTKTYAASGNISVSSGSVYVGDSFITSVNVSGAAAWNVHVTASGPVTNCSINQADATADATDTNKTFTANCVTTGEGTVTVSLSGDVTSASDGNAVNISGSRSVTVVKKAEPTPTPQPTPTPDNGNNNQDNKPEEKKSNNNKVKAIAVDGYELVKVDDNNYTLSVDNKVEKINIQLAAEDAKATVIGTGEKELKVGENTIEIIVQAEDGTQNKITVKVTREKEKKVTPKKNDTEKDTKKDTKKESSKKDLKVTILLIILFILDIVLAATVILLALQNNKLRKNRY